MLIALHAAGGVALLESPSQCSSSHIFVRGRSFLMVVTWLQVVDRQAKTLAHLHQTDWHQSKMRVATYSINCAYGDSKFAQITRL